MMFRMLVLLWTSFGLIDDLKVRSVADTGVLASISVADFVVLDNKFWTGLTIMGIGYVCGAAWVQKKAEPHGCLPGLGTS